MGDALGISTAGMQVSANRLDADAREIVKASSPNPLVGGNADNAAVAQKEDAISYKANASTFKMADQTRGTLLNVIT